mgnify:CR=1 FL=1
MEIAHIPLSFYVHIPWCEKKCPYCDFNSHAIKDVMPEEKYVEALLIDAQMEINALRGRTISSIFFGGGTPNIFSALSIGKILTFIKANFSVLPNAEVTVEANPSRYCISSGKQIEESLLELRQVGVNRLSVGVQSFNDNNLLKIGRLHTGGQAVDFVNMSLHIFSNVNLDIMYGLPDQSIGDFHLDIEKALILKPSHLSVYQLTIEENTEFSSFRPNLPKDEVIWSMYQKLIQELKDADYHRYEISAFSLKGSECFHNKNYWLFGDYIGIGAGAHSKLSFEDRIERQNCFRQPDKYMEMVLKRNGSHKLRKNLKVEELPGEFMLNVLRLIDGFDVSLYSSRTGQKFQEIRKLVNLAEEKKLLTIFGNKIKPTMLGLNFLTDLQEIFF